MPPKITVKEVEYFREVVSPDGEVFPRLLKTTKFYRDADTIEVEANVPFRARLEFKCLYGAQGNFLFRNIDTGTEYLMTQTEFIKAMQSFSITQGVMFGDFFVRRRGADYFLASYAD